MLIWLGKTVAAVCSWSKTFLLKLGKTACQGPDMGPCATVGPRESQGKTKFKRESTNRIQLSQHYFEMMFALISSYFHISLASFFFAWLHVEFKNSVDAANPQTLLVWSGLGLDSYNTEQGEDVACPDLQAPHECGECWSWGTDVKDVGRMLEHLSGKIIQDNLSDTWWYRPTWFQVCNWSTPQGNWSWWESIPALVGIETTIAEEASSPTICLVPNTFPKFPGSQVWIWQRWGRTKLSMTGHSQ